VANNPYDSVNLLGTNGMKVLNKGNGTIIFTPPASANAQGTYNKTLANNVIINSGGNRINFLNGTNNPVKVINDPTRNQVNITVLSTGGGSGTITGIINIGHGGKGVGAGVSGSNVQTKNITSTRTDLITVSSNGTDVNLGSSFKSNTITCTNQFISAFSNVTGLYTCATATDTNTAQLTSMVNKGWVLNGTRLNATSNSVKSLGQGAGITLSNSTSGMVIISANVISDTNTAQIGNSGTHTSIFGSRINATQNNLKTLIGTGCVTVSSNSTDVIINCPTITDTNTAQVTNIGTANGLGLQVQRTNATNNNLRSITCGTGLTCSNNATNFRINSTGLSSAITSINSQTGPAINIVKGSLHNVKITNSSNTITIEANNTAQVTNLGTANGLGIQVSRTNATNNNLRSITCGVGLTCSNNATNTRINGTVTDTNTAQVTNVGTANGLGLQVSRTNATNNNLRSITCGAGLSCSNNATNFRINSTGLSTAITSINSQTGPAIIIHGGALHNVKVTNSTNNISIESNNTAQISNAQASNTGLFGSRLNATQNTIKVLISGKGIGLSNNSTSATITNNAVYLNFTSKINSYTALSTDNVILINATTGNYTVTIPSIASLNTGKEYTIKKIDYSKNYIEIVPTGSTIDYFNNFNMSNPMDTLTIANNGTSWFTKNKILSNDIMPLRNTGNSWYGSWATQGTPTTLGLANNTLYAIPFSLKRTTSLSQIESEVTTPGTGSSCRMALYDSFAGYPVNKIQGSDVGTLTTQTRSARTIINNFTSNINLQEGDYFNAIDCNYGTVPATIGTDVITAPIHVNSVTNATQIISITIGVNTNKIVIVGISLIKATTASPVLSNDVISSVKIGSVSFTKALNASRYNSTQPFSLSSELWYSTAIPTGAVHITITPSTTTTYFMVAGAYSLYNVLQASPIGITATNGTSSNATGTTTRTSSISDTPLRTNSWLIENIAGLPTNPGSGSGSQNPTNPSDTQAWSSHDTNAEEGASQYKITPSIGSANKMTWVLNSPPAVRTSVSDAVIELKPAVQGAGNIPTLRSIPTSSLFPFLGMPQTMGATNGGTMYTTTYTMGTTSLSALPSPFTTNGAIATTDVPEILFKAVK
jgi:hypothetical protein